MNKLFKINKNDNVAVALEPLKQGEVADGIKILDDIPFGHKVLLEDKNENENIIKYGNAIGHLTKYCKKGEHIHEHNLKTNLSDIIDYSFGGDNKYEPKESSWIDLDAGKLIEKPDFDNMTEEIFKLLIDTASGKKTKNELND